MLIISPDYRDYYDVMMKLGIDRGIIYRRERRKITGRVESITALDCGGYSRKRQDYFRIGSGFIAVAGKFYTYVNPYFEYEKEVYTNDEYCYTTEQVDRYVHKYLDKKYIEL